MPPVTTTAYIGRKLWSGAAIYFNPEMAGSNGLSSTLGIAGFPNGETRIGLHRQWHMCFYIPGQQINLDESHLIHWMTV
jgi:hypothetical protein